jgi:hypothetical protein
MGLACPVRSVIAGLAGTAAMTLAIVEDRFDRSPRRGIDV